MDSRRVASDTVSRTVRRGGYVRSVKAVEPGAATASSPRAHRVRPPPAPHQWERATEPRPARAFPPALPAFLIAWRARRAYSSPPPHANLNFVCRRWLHSRLYLMLQTKHNMLPAQLNSFELGTI
ncbi:unnamed protein product [Arctia plantaginis]|uniref:Uncharacterized protein n=1 Tax=Arctia plantaginis TaxID=874455 RepID=A0A8S0ZI09_ARCPL|nr:unnamed protein product [Arctia plantaginis]CAB3251344.1 unnamed protein product [Arctia plantaginis]